MSELPHSSDPATPGYVLDNRAGIIPIPQFMAALTEAWRAGSECARRVVEALQVAYEPGEFDAERWG